MDHALLGKGTPAAGRMKSNKIYGLVTAIVTDNVHPEGDYRVRVRFPWLPGTDQSWWARVATLGAAPGGQGAFFLPEIDSEVVVAFENGDFDHPIVVGTLWNGVDKPSYSNKDGSSPTKRFQSSHGSFLGKTAAKKNDVRSLSSRKAHELVFNDNQDKPMVVLASGQKHRIVLSDAGNEPTQIEIYDGKEENYVLIDTKNKKITVESKTGEILLKAKEKIRLEAKVIETASDQGTSMKVGSNFELKASSNMTLKASGQGDIESSGTMTIKGSTVNIN